MNGSLKRFLSLVLAFVMVLSCVPVNAFASEVCEHAGGVTITSTATCTEAGELVTTCNTCGVIISTETAEATGHNFVEGICTVCEEVEIPAEPVNEDSDVEDSNVEESNEEASNAEDSNAEASDALELNAVDLKEELLDAEGSEEEQLSAVMIENQGYATLSDALTAASAMTGNVEVWILDKVTLNSSLSGSFDSIKFMGMAADAEIYLDVQGYITATGKKVAFEDLTLSKSAGGFITNAGFMNVAFGVYDVAEVTYTRCTFANGAYASSGKVTFTGCTFKRSHDKYGLWAYGDVETIVEGCTFAEYRGIKMYAEGAAKTVDLTVKNTDFSAVDNKPAIVLTYGESVTLEGNTYSSKGTFELDLDGAPNGTAVTSDVPPTCVNDNGDCGVLVDGKIYTTVAQAAEVATSGSTVTLLHNSTETVVLPEGVKLEKNGFDATGVTVVEPAVPAAVAQIGDTEYTTLQAAVNVGGNITLLDSVTEDIQIPDNATVVLDLNTKTLNGYIAPFEGDLTVKNGAIVNNDGSKSAIEITAGELKLVDVNVTSARHAVRIDGAVTAVIDGGEYKPNATSGTRHAVNVSGAANVTIKSGEFVGPAGTTMDSGSAVCVQAGATVTIEGGNFSKGKNSTLGVSGTMTVTGGTFDQDPSAYLSDGYAALPNLDGKFVVGTDPTATVKNLGEMTVPANAYYIYNGSLTTGTVDMPLNFVMQFIADQDEEDMETSPFADWYADFVITFEGIEGGSFVPTGCYLAGYYGSTDSWDGMWVKIPVEGVLNTVDEGTRYPVMMGVGMPQTYDYICSGVQAFSCAMYIPEAILEANPNLKVNLELNVVDSSDDNKALEALQTGKNIYKVSDTSYTAEDFVSKTYVAQIGETKYETLADALTEAADGATIELIWAEGDAPIAMNGAVYGKSVTITGTAQVDWSKGWLFVGRGGEGNGTVIFDDANLTSASNSATYGIHVSGREKGTDNKYDGTLVIKDSTIELDYLINRGAIEVDNSTFTVKNGFGIAGRPSTETESGEAATATIDIKNNSYVKVLTHNGMGVGVASNVKEGNGILNLTDSTFECASFNVDKELGDFNVYGESTVNIATLSGKEINLQNGAIVKDSTVGGHVLVLGKVTFRGDNTVALIEDYGDAYSSASADWTVEAGASLTMTEKARWGLGYGDKATILGNIEDALNARETLTEDDLSLFTHGVVAMSSWAAGGDLTVKDAYVVIGQNNSLGNTSKSGYKGSYNFKFENAVLDSSRITFYEAGSTTNFEAIKSDMQVGTFMTRDADSVFTLTNTKLVSTTTTNGNDEGNYHAGTLVLNNSELTYSAPLVMENGSLTVGAGSSLTAPSITGTGKIVIDASGLKAGDEPIKGDASGYTGTIEVTGNDALKAEIDENGNIVLAEKPAPVAQALNAAGEVVGSYYDFETALAAACGDTNISRIEILSDIEQNAIVNTSYNDITHALTIGVPEGETHTVTINVTGDSIAVRVMGEGASLTIEKNLIIEGLDVVANGFATNNENMIIDGTVKALSLKQWTNNGTITVSETGKVWLGYGDGQLDLAYGNGTVTVNGTLDSTADLTGLEPQFKAGYSGTRGNGNTLNLKDTYFEGGAWFNVNGSNGTFNVENSVMKVSGGDGAGKLDIASSGNEFNLTNGSRLLVANLIIGAENTVNIDSTSTIESTTITGAGSIVIDAANMTDGVQVITADMSGFTGTISVINNDAASAKITDTGVVIESPKGDNSYGYTKEEGGYVRVWGQTDRTNPAESFVLKLYSGDTLIATTALQDVDDIMNGATRDITWNFYYPKSNDEYWVTTWEEDHPNSAAQPTHVILYVDGVEVANTPAKMSGADDVNPVEWAKLGGVKYVCTGLEGEGTEASPYLISRVEELIWFRDKVDELAQDGSTQFAGKYFKLTADIDLAGINWDPIGTMSDDHGSFKGVFDGDNHTIFNLTVEQAGNGLGLFARTTGNAEIKNLNLHNVTVKSTDNSNYVGGVVGNSYASTKITNVHVTGNVDISGRGYIGGISGHGYVVMDNVSVVGTGTISSTFWCAGGILGYAGEGATNIMNAHVEGITITSAAGGLGAIVGMAEDNEGTQPISGSNLSAKNVEIKTYTGAYGGAYANYALGYLYGGNPTSKLTGTLTVENVTVETSTGEAPVLVDVAASIGTAPYFSLQAAIEAVQEGETITILKDITITEGANGTTNGISYTRDASFDINLNGKTITSNLGNNALRFKIGDGTTITKDVTINIYGGKVVSGSNNWCAISAASADTNYTLTVNLSDMTVEASKAGDLAVKSWAGAVVNANNVTVNATNGAGGFYAVGGEIVLDNCTVTQKGLHTAPYLSMAIAVSSGGTMTVNSGTYSAEPTAAAEGNNQGTSHGSWVGGVMNSGGTLTIKGGTFSNDNFGDNALATYARGLILADTGANIQIEGGTFHALKGIVDIQNNLGDASKNPTGEIKGGTFSADPTNDYVKIAEGYDVTKNDNGTYGVEKNPAYGAVAKIGENYYATLAEALTAAANGAIIELIWAEGDAPIAMNGAVYGKSVTITGTATVDWSKEWLFVGRGGEGDGTVIFDNANLTSASNSASYGIHVSGREKGTDNKYDGTLVIKDSTIELDYLINRGAIEVDNSTFTVKNGFGIAGRPSTETESGEAATATIDIKNNSYVKVLTHNGMGVGVASNVKEGNGILNLTNSTFECANFNVDKELGVFNVYGESTVNIATLSGNSIDLNEGAIVKDSTVGGTVYVAGNVIFSGNNTFTMITDYGDYYSKETPSLWTVEKGGSLTLTSSDRYGLGYGDQVTVYGEIENALTARENLTDADADVNMYGGLVGMTNSAAPDSQNKFTAQDAYLIFGVQGDKSFGNKPGNYYGNYEFNFNNSVVTANGFKFYEDKGNSVLTMNKTDLQVNGVFMTNDTDSKFTFTDSVIVSKATSNGTDDKNQNAGELTLIRSSLTYNAAFTNAGTLTVGADSSLTAPSITGTGKIVIDASGLKAGDEPIKGDASGYTGTIEVTGNDALKAEIVDDKIVLAPVTFVAQIGETMYKSLQDAIDKAENEDEIILLENIDLAKTELQVLDDSFDTYFKVEGKTVTINLNEKTISGEYKGTKTMLVGVFSTDNNGHLTLTGNGTVNVTATNKVYSLIANYEAGCSITIKNGTYTLDAASDSLIYTGGSEAVIVEGGSFTLGNVGTGSNGKPWIFNALDSNERHVIVTGGTFNANVYNQYWRHEVQCPEDNIKAIKDNGNGTWTVVDAEAYVIENVEGYPYYVGYVTLAEAMAAAQDGETVTLLTNVTLTETVTIENAITLDLNGHVISGTCGANQGHLFMVANAAKLTIKDSSAEATGKITYEGNSSTGWIVDVEGDLVLESGTLELTGTWGIGYAVDVRPNAWGTAYTAPTTFTMNGGKIVSSDGAVRVASSSADSYKDVSAAFTMNGGLIDAAWDGVFVQQSNAAWDKLSFTMTGGTIQSDLNPIRLYGPAATSYVNGEDCMSINLNGGTLSYTYTGTETRVWLVDGMIRTGGGATAAEFVKDTAITASAEFAKTNVAEGFKWAENEDGTYTLTEATYVAQIGETGYETLAKAIAAAKAGDTITFLSDITEEVTVDRAVIINGADKTYTGKMNVTANITIQNVNFDGKGANVYAVETRGAGYVVIENCTAKNYGYGFLQVASNNNTVTIKNVTITDVAYGVKVDYSNGVTLENVKITATTAALLNSNYGTKTITIKDSDLSILGTWKRNDTTKTTYVFEGENAVNEFVIEAVVDEFKLATGATLTAPNDITVTAKEAGYSVKYEEGKYFTKANVAAIGEETYASLEEAIAAADAGDTITVLTDIVLTETIKVEAGKTVTLDLNGHVIDGTENVNIALMSYGDLTIKDSSDEKTGAIKAGKTSGKSGNAVNICGGTFTLESGSIYSVNNAILIDEEAAVINIKGGTITAEPATSNSAAMYVSSTSDTEINISGGEIVGYNGILLWNNTTIDMTGGSIEAKGSVGIQGNGSKDNTEINISGDASVSGYYAAIYHPQGGDLNISGNATLTGWTGVVVKGGNVNISGGTISGTGAADTYEPVSSGFKDTGDGLYVEHYDNSTNSENYGIPTVTVTGGTFTSVNGKAVASYANTNNAGVEPLTGFISGGTFSSDVKDLCADGYTTELNENGTYGIVEKKDDIHIRINADNMTLGNTLAINFWVYKNQMREGVEYTARLIRYRENKEPETILVPMSEWVDMGNYYQVVYDKFAAKEMTDKVSIEILMPDGTSASNVFTDSIQEFAMWMLENQFNKVEQTTAFVDMLNYGTAAQKEFTYKTNDLANAKLTAEQKAMATPPVTPVDDWTSDGNGVGSNLELADRIILRLWFENVEEDMYALVSFTNHYGTLIETRVEFEEFFMHDRAKRIYSVPVNDLVVADGFQKVTCKLYNSNDEIVGTITESVQSYIKFMIDSGDDKNGLLDATLKFVKSAYNLFH